jgi:uncharacterized membrane protein
MSDTVPVFPTPGPRIRVVPANRPWLWLARGWADFTRAPQICLAYGLALVATSFALTLGLLLADLPYLLLPLASGFTFVAPILAVGLYEVSRRLELGQRASLAEAATAWRRNSLQIALAGFVLAFFQLVWVRTATLLFALFFSDAAPSLNRLVETLLFSPTSLAFLVVGAVIGAIFAAGVFAIAAISIPMLLDRDVGVVTAIATSVTAVLVNWPAMVLWAVLIAVFTALGLATLYLGLAVILPLVGLASWHAYRDLVE